MKTIHVFLSTLFLFSFIACNEDDVTPVVPAQEYYVFTYSPSDDNAYGVDRGFFKISPNAGTFQAERLNNYYPTYGWGDSYMHFNASGMCAFYCDPALKPATAATSLAYFTADAPADVKFLPLPAKETGYTWDIFTQKPKVLSNGKIVVVMTIYTDLQYDDWHDEAVAVYDPATDTYDMGPGVTGFILAQPEKGWDTEAGTISKDFFAVSLDESTVLLKAAGWGVDGGSVHNDAAYIVAYNMVLKSFSRVYYGDNQIFGVTQNRVYFRSGQGYTASIDLATLELFPTVDDYPDDYYIFSKFNEQIVKAWRGSGMGALTWNGSTYEWMHIINTANLSSTTYAGLGGRPCYNKDESAIYFSASKDFYTNYASEFAVMKTPVMAENPTPEIQFILPKNFSTCFFHHQP